MSLSNKKCLIAYYSRRGQNYVNGSIKELKVGNTEVVAEIIKTVSGGDLFHIETVKAYPKDYTETTEVAKSELRSNARPPLTGRVDNMDAYDVIFLGYPNWWGTMPMPVFTFLDSYDFSEKIIVPFCTHEGSGLGRSEQDIKKQCQKSKVLAGVAIRGANSSSSEQRIDVWINKLGFPDLNIAQR